MAKRKAISNRLRFEVFKRDKFTCQYCGKRAPDVVLNIDHIEPVASGGKNDLLNLVTSCFDCNSGKSDKRLSDGTAINAQLDQLAMIQEKRNQLELIKQWLDESGRMQDEVLLVIEERIRKTFGCNLTEAGRKSFGSHVKKYGLMEVAEAIDVAAEQYADTDVAISKISGILKYKRLAKEDPEAAKFFRVYGYLKKKFGYVDNRKFWAEISEARRVGVTSESVMDFVKDADKEYRFYTSLRIATAELRDA